MPYWNTFWDITVRVCTGRAPQIVPVQRKSEPLVNRGKPRVSRLNKTLRPVFVQTNRNNDCTFPSSELPVLQVVVRVHVQ